MSGRLIEMLANSTHCLSRRMYLHGDVSQQAEAPRPLWCIVHAEWQSPEARTETKKRNPLVMLEQRCTPIHRPGFLFRHRASSRLWPEHALVVVVRQLHPEVLAVAVGIDLLETDNVGVLRSDLLHDELLPVVPRQGHRWDIAVLAAGRVSIAQDVVRKNRELVDRNTRR